MRVRVKGQTGHLRLKISFKLDPYKIVCISLINAML